MSLLSRALLQARHSLAATRTFTSVATRVQMPSVLCRVQPMRFMSTIPTNRSELEERVLKVISGFERVDKSKVRVISQVNLIIYGLQVTLGAHFVKDLGLDSLDAVELVVALEEEFGEKLLFTIISIECTYLYDTIRCLFSD
jgi:acyl carrier protein